MTDEEIKNYILSHNLDIRTIEQIVSFMNDNDKRYCGGLGWRDKKDVVRYVYGSRFDEIWKSVQTEMKEQRRRKYNV